MYCECASLVDSQELRTWALNPACPLPRHLSQTWARGETAALALAARFPFPRNRGQGVRGWGPVQNLKTRKGPLPQPLSQFWARGATATMALALTARFPFPRFRGKGLGEGGQCSALKPNIIHRAKSANELSAPLPNPPTARTAHPPKWHLMNPRAGAIVACSPRFPRIAAH